MDTRMARGMQGLESCTAASISRLQALSTRCALIGSVAAVLDAWTQDMRQGKPSWLELSAVALITASLLLEAIAYLRRHRNGLRSFCCIQGKCWWPRPQILLVVVGLAVTMGGFTALGTTAAKRLGIVPRTLGGLPGVLFGCFVHLSWPHCCRNALALLFLGPCVLRAVSSTTATPHQAGDKAEGGCPITTGVGHFAAVSMFIAVSSGFCVWCLARPALHAGASGVVCGYVGLLLALALRRRDVPVGSLLMVLGVVSCYGGAALLVWPAAGGRLDCAPGQCPDIGLLLYKACTSKTLSAEHHTFGFLSGLASALFLCQARTVESENV